MTDTTREPRTAAELRDQLIEFAPSPMVDAYRAAIEAEAAPDAALREALLRLQGVLNGIISDGPVIDSMDAESPWWTPPNETGVRLHDAIFAASKAVDAALADEAAPDTALLTDEAIGWTVLYDDYEKGTAFLTADPHNGQEPIAADLPYEVAESIAVAHNAALAAPPPAEAVEALRALVDAVDEQLRPAQAVGGWGDSPLSQAVDEAHRIMAALPTSPPALDERQRLNDEYMRGYRAASRMIDAASPEPALDVERLALALYRNDYPD